MLRKALLFVSANVLFIALVVGIYEAGYEYDKAHKLYPENKELSYDLFMQVYGQRWERVAKSLLAGGLIIDSAVLLAWYRKRQSGDRHRLDITKLYEHRRSST